MSFTSETAKAARAIRTAQQAVRPFDRRGWTRAWMRRERARRRAVGLCQRCGGVPVEKFTKCLTCRRQRAVRRGGA